MNAERLVKRMLYEGTVIVLNTDSGSAGELGGALQRILGQEAGQSLAAPQPVPDAGAGMPVTTRGGKRWIFKVNRDSAGSITSIEAQEP